MDNQSFNRSAYAIPHESWANFCNTCTSQHANVWKRCQDLLYCTKYYSGLWVKISCMGLVLAGHACPMCPPFSCSLCEKYIGQRYLVNHLLNQWSLKNECHHILWYHFIYPGSLDVRGDGYCVSVCIGAVGMWDYCVFLSSVSWLCKSFFLPRNPTYAPPRAPAVLAICVYVCVCVCTCVCEGEAMIMCTDMGVVTRSKPANHNNSVYSGITTHLQQLWSLQFWVLPEPPGVPLQPLPPHPLPVPHPLAADIASHSADYPKGQR